MTETEWRNKVGCCTEAAVALVQAFSETYWREVKKGKSPAEASKSAEAACSEKAAYIHKVRKIQMEIENERDN